MGDWVEFTKAYLNSCLITREEARKAFGLDQEDVIQGEVITNEIEA